MMSATLPYDLERLRIETFYDPTFDFTGQLFYLGLQYAQHRDDELAGTCLLALAAERGHPEAQFLLSQYYFEGKGELSSPSEAIEWLKRSACHGYSEAMFVLAMMYLNGDEVEQDLHAARDWFRRCALQGHTGAMLQLGKMLEKPIEYPESIFWLKQVAEKDGLPVESVMARRASEPSKMRPVLPQEKKARVETTEKKDSGQNIISYESAVHNIALF